MNDGGGQSRPPPFAAGEAYARALDAQNKLFAAVTAEERAAIDADPAVRAAALYAAARMHANEGSHGYAHARRVHRRALQLGLAEARGGERAVDLRLVQLAALLHDVYDRKVYVPGPGAPPGAQLLLAFLASLGLPEAFARRVVQIADGISFSKQQEMQTRPDAPLAAAPRSVEMDIVQDADRLDAIGAVGVARCFAYGGRAGRPLEDSRAHFDEKLLSLQGLMRTAAGARLARERHDFMVAFVRQMDSEME